MHSPNNKYYMDILRINKGKLWKEAFEDMNELLVKEMKENL